MPTRCRHETTFGNPAASLSEFFCYFNTEIHVPGSTGSTVVTGINDAGQIVGYCNLGSFIDTGGTYYTFLQRSAVDHRDYRRGGTKGSRSKLANCLLRSTVGSLKGSARAI